MGIRKSGFGIIGVAMLVLGCASAAFACSVQPQVSYSLLPESATPGATVMVEGQNVRARTPIEIRWNGVNGKVLASVSPDSGAFAVPVQIPEAAPGIYSLMLVTESAGVGRTAFEVIGSAADAPTSAPTGQLWPNASDAAQRGATDPSLVGVGLLALGLVGLFAGSTVAVARRRRVPA